MVMKKNIDERFLNIKDVVKCFFAYLLDLSVSLLPMALWNVVMIAVFGSMISMSGLDIVNGITKILVIVAALVLNPLFIVKNKGQTLGMALYNLKIAKKDGSEASIVIMLIREVVYFSLPVILIFLTLNIYLALGYILINSLCVLIDVKHRTLIDFILQTCLIKTKVELNEEISEMEEVVVKEETKVKDKIKEVSDCKVDMQVHSYFSKDGKCSVEEIFKYASEHGVDLLSITDLNSVKSDMMARQMSELYHVDYISGIEIETQLYGKPIRILGYGIDTKSDLFATLENESLMNEQSASKRRMSLVERYMDITLEKELFLKDNKFQEVSSTTLAKYLICNYREHPLLKDYALMNVEDALYYLEKDLFTLGKPCYVQKNYPSLKDILDVIEFTGGISVIADPYRLMVEEPALYREIVNMPQIKGVQAFRGDYSKDMMAKVVANAKQHQLKLTCGSDFYKFTKDNTIGKSGYPASADNLVRMIVEDIK